MTDARWHRIEAVCDAALERPAAERAAFVRNESAGDNELQREVEALLAHQAAAEGFLETSVGAMAAAIIPARGPLLTGRRLGHFDVGPLLGLGGMGEVYQAFDSELGRSVALKILPEVVATDPGRLARFRREAHLLASLNHPNVAAIHGFEEAEGVPTLVLELVEGPTLADRLVRDPMAVDEALPIARQVASGLEAAHEQGIVHRDLKPANIKLRPDGTVKILDFGLAKATDPISVADTPSVTHPGMILGTAPYMSPEQAKSRPADKADDVWAFGAVVYEMLSGQRAFAGDDTPDTLASVLRQDVEWTALPPSTPASVRRLLRRCLDRDVARRLRDIREARIVLENPAHDAEDVRAPVGARRISSRWWAAGAAVTIAAAIAAIALRPAAGTVPTTAGPTRFTIAAPPGLSFGSLRSGGTGVATQQALSPDGRTVAFVAGDPPAFQIWLRPMANPAPTPISGTEGGTFPFWSPDNRFVGFFADGKLKKVEIATGHVTVLCEAPSGRGGTWNRYHVIVFAPSNRAGTGLMRVSSAGGQPVPVTQAVAATDEHHAWSHFLPDGVHFIYTASIGICCPAPKPSRIRIGSLDPDEAVTTLFDAESSVTYAAGHLLFGRDGMLMALPFDPETRRADGEPFPVAEDVSSEGSRYVSVSASENGTLVYGHAGTVPQRLTWFDRTGRPLGTVGEPAEYADIALSPDQRRIVAAVGGPSNPESPNRDIWVIDISRNAAEARHTFGPGMDSKPVWAPDGASIAFSAQRFRQSSLRLIRLDRRDDELLLEGPEVSQLTGANITPTSWSSDGLYIAYSVAGDIWALPRFGDQKPFPVVRAESVQTSGVFSPDGRWLAYASDEEGQFNVYVQPFPSGGKHQVSVGGGSQPVWRADGRELFYLAADATLVAVPVVTSPAFAAGSPERLFPTRASMPTYGTPIPRFNVYSPTRDGQRFVVTSPQPSGAAPLTVIVNWLGAVQK